LKIKQASSETSNLTSPSEISKLRGKISINSKYLDQYEHLTNF